MSKAATTPSTEAPSTKVANAALVKGGLSGIRWLYQRAAGPAMQGAGLGSKIYNNALRPARAILLPNLGRVGNMARMGVASYGAGKTLANADTKFQENRQAILQMANSMMPEARKMILERSSRLGALGSAAKSIYGLNRKAPEVAKAADDLVGIGFTEAVRHGLKSHDTDTKSGKTLSSWINPVGSRALSSGLTSLAGKSKGIGDYAQGFATKYKGLLNSPETKAKVMSMANSATAAMSGVKRLGSGG